MNVTSSGNVQKEDDLKTKFTVTTIIKAAVINSFIQTNDPTSVNYLC